jgi:hypothetical protein
MDAMVLDLHHSHAYREVSLFRLAYERIRHLFSPSRVSRAQIPDRAEAWLSARFSHMQ